MGNMHNLLVSEEPSSLKCKLELQSGHVTVGQKDIWKAQEGQGGFIRGVNMGPEA